MYKTLAVGKQCERIMRIPIVGSSADNGGATSGRMRLSFLILLHLNHPVFPFIPATGWATPGWSNPHFLLRFISFAAGEVGDG